MEKSIPFRCSEELHARIKENAKIMGLSMNNFIQQTMTASMDRGDLVDPLIEKLEAQIEELKKLKKQ